MATKALNYTTAEINQRLNLAGIAAQTSANNQADIAELKSDIVVDLSTRYSTSYANLSVALTALNSDIATDAAAIKKAGVSIKFINSSTNKYEQWNLKASSWSTNTSDWALDVDGSVTNGKLKLPFELEKPSNDTFVTKTSEIGHGNKSAEEEIEEIQDFLEPMHETSEAEKSYSGTNRDSGRVALGFSATEGDVITVTVLEEAQTHTVNLYLFYDGSTSTAIPVKSGATEGEKIYFPVPSEVNYFKVVAAGSGAADGYSRKALWQKNVIPYITERVDKLEESSDIVNTIENVTDIKGSTIHGKISESGWTDSSVTTADITGFVDVKPGDVILYSGRVAPNRYNDGRDNSGVWGFDAKTSNPNTGTMVRLLRPGEYNRKEIIIPQGINYIKAWSCNESHATTPSKLELFRIGGDLSKLKYKRYIVVDANGYGDYTSLQDAIEASDDRYFRPNSKDAYPIPTVIVVMPGVYEMDTLTAAERDSRTYRNLAIVGVDKCQCVIRNHKGYYATDTYEDNAPLILSGNIYIANLTVIATSEDYDTYYPATDYQRSNRCYCIHCDGNAYEGSVIEIHNCILKNDHCACVGIGLRAGMEARITDCIMETQMDLTNNVDYNAVVQGHDGGVSTHPEDQHITIKNCIIKNKTSRLAFRWSVISNGAPSLVTAVNNVMKTTDNANCLALGTLDDVVFLDDVNYGNNINALNTL